MGASAAPRVPQGASGPKSAEASLNPERAFDGAKYRGWVVEKYRNLEMVGLGQGHVGVHLDDVYVGLTLLGGALRRAAPSRAAELEAERSEEVDLVDVLRVAKKREIAILGEPGAGKTTALKKLLIVAAQKGPEALGLPGELQPVFLPLRRMTNEDLEAPIPLRAFLVRELVRESGGEISESEAEQLWSGSLLLLLEALDEVAEARRARVIEALRNARAGLRGPGLPDGRVLSAPARGRPRR